MKNQKKLNNITTKAIVTKYQKRQTPQSLLYRERVVRQ